VSKTARIVSTHSVCIALFLLSQFVISTSFAAEPFAATTRQIDERLAAHWQAKNITPAKVAPAATLLKRITLDLHGRIPTQAEFDARLKDGKPLGERYPAIVAELLDSPEFSLHMGAMLDEMWTSATTSAAVCEKENRGIRFFASCWSVPGMSLSASRRQSFWNFVPRTSTN
jgi:hypothetical protein